jgi:hypothetical protein
MLILGVCNLILGGSNARLKLKIKYLKVQLMKKIQKKKANKKARH